MEKKNNKLYMEYRGKKFEVLNGEFLALTQLGIESIYEIDGLEKFKNLKELHLEDNNINEIKGLDALIDLEVLDLRDNKITEIKGLDNLLKLRKLHLSNNKITEIKGLEKLTNLTFIDLYNNPLKGVEDFIVNSGFDAAKILEYCKNKNIEIDEIRYLREYDFTKPFEENCENIRKILSETDHSDLINIGTNLEKKRISIMQNITFYHQKPKEIHLNKKNMELKKIITNIIQINSLKGAKSKKRDKIGHFLFFVKQFWDQNELSKNVLIYNQNNWINSKIDEFLSLSLLNKPKLIVFPENSVPYNKIEELQEFSKNNNILLICGMEHKREDNKYINRVIIIDNGKYGEQIKQTPVEIKKRDGNHLRENIKCETYPKITIFSTTIGRIAIFVYKDFLRLCDKIPEWAGKNEVDFIVIPSLTSKILPFHTKLLNLLNYSKYNRLKFIFASIGEYGGSEFFTIDQIKRVEESFRKNVRDNVGEIIVSREYILRGKNVKYQDGYVYIICDNCGLEYTVLTNGRHLLSADASHLEKDKWEFYLRCSCGYKNYRYL